MLPQVKVPQEKTAGIADGVMKFLRGNKALTPKQLEYVAKHVTPSGFGHLDPNKGFLKSIFTGGHASPLGVLKSRYMQGGVFGKGGIVRGDLAFDHRTIEGLKKIRAGDIAPGWQGVKQVAGTAGSTLFDAANPYFALGLPAIAVHAGLKDENLTNKQKAGILGGEAGAVLGYALGGPLGLVGSMVAGGLAQAGGQKAVSSLVGGKGVPVTAGSYRAPAPQEVAQGYSAPYYPQESMGLYADSYGDRSYDGIPFGGDYSLQNLQETDLNTYNSLQRGGNESILPVTRGESSGYLPLPEIPGSY